MRRSALFDVLQVGVNLSRARSFKGVSFDAVVILGEDPRETSTASLDREVLLKPSRVTDIVTAAVKGNKCVAACGDGVLALAPAKFRDKPILYRKSIAATKEVAAALSRCDIEHFLNDGAAKAEVQAPELGAGAKPVAAVNKDRRLFTTARPQVRGRAITVKHQNRASPVGIVSGGPPIQSLWYRLA